MKMTQEEMKRYFLNESRDVSIAIENFVVDDSTTENSLSKAKSSAKKLIEKIDEYLEYQKPKFKVGDYVTFDIPNKKIAKIERLNGALYGLWYDTESENIKDDLYFGSGNKFRHATPSEIEEYEVALTFHKHGRKPFELKKGDLIRKPSGDFTFVFNPENYTKEDFLKYGWEFRSPVEEVDEWLENK